MKPVERNDLYRALKNFRNLTDIFTRMPEDALSMNKNIKKERKKEKDLKEKKKKIMREEVSRDNLESKVDKIRTF